MSWDILIMNIPDEIKSASEIPENFSSILGKKWEVLNILKELFSNADFSDTSWVILDDDSFSIEFNLGDEEIIDSIMLHVRGNDGPIEVIKKLCDKTSWRAFDTSTGNFIDFNNNPEEGFEKWKEFRNRVISKSNRKSFPEGNKHWWEFWKK